MYSAEYRSRGEVVRTKIYDTPREAWEALGRGLDRRGINPGPWHLPGVVSGDTGRFEPVARAGGSAVIIRRS